MSGTAARVLWSELLGKKGLTFCPSVPPVLSEQESLLFGRVAGAGATQSRYFWLIPEPFLLSGSYSYSYFTVKQLYKS